MSYLSDDKDFYILDTCLALGHGRVVDSYQVAKSRAPGSGTKKCENLIF